MSKIGEEIIETSDVALANTASTALNPDGSHMYSKAQYDVDRHVFVLIKSRPRKAKAEVVV